MSTNSGSMELKAKKADGQAKGTGLNNPGLGEVVDSQPSTIETLK